MKHEIYRHNPDGTNTLIRTETLPDDPNEARWATVARLKAKAKSRTMSMPEIQELLHAMLALKSGED